MNIMYVIDVHFVEEKSAISFVNTMKGVRSSVKSTALQISSHLISSHLNEVARAYI